MRALGLAILLGVWTASSGIRSFAQDSPGGPPSYLQDRPAPGAPPSFERSKSEAVIGGRPGSMRPRVPITTRPQGPAHVAPMPQSPLKPEAVAPAFPLPNSRWVLFETDDEGPPNGLTIEQATSRLLTASVTLRARALDIPQAEADVLTAGLHANPVVYADGQLLPYRPYNLTTNPGGPAQYDLNMAYPADLSGKRTARVEVANAAQRVVQALYQDSVRQEVARLGTTYVDALAARMSVRTIRAALARIDEVQSRVSTEPKDPQQSEVLRRQIALQRQAVTLGLVEAEMSLRSCQRSLAMLLDLPASNVESLELHGSVKDQAPWAPPVDRLRSLANANRPDLAAYRLGVQRAGADVQLSRANRLPDVYLLYQPLTYQDLTPFGAGASRSWAAGATVVLPIFDRNQGNIRRSEVNVQQTQLEMQALERRISIEVENAYDEYLATRRTIEEFERNLLPEAAKMRHEHVEHFRSGTLDAADYLVAERELDDLGRQYRDLLIRHRRSMLNLNTAVGVRVLP